jgi:hypothetical protein
VGGIGVDRARTKNLGEISEAKRIKKNEYKQNLFSE